MKKVIRIQFCIAIYFALTMPFSVFAQSSGDVKIGNQIWMSKNLDVDRFRNGDVIPEVKTKAEWMEFGNNGKPAWCYYNNDPNSGKIYGKLYNWYAVNDPRGLAPSGYHIPKDSEWRNLIEYLGGEFEAGEELKSKSGWKNKGKKSGSGRNSSGFNGLPSGYVTYDFLFLQKMTDGHWWSSTEFNFKKAWHWTQSNYSAQVYRSNNLKSLGLSVRCLKD